MQHHDGIVGLVAYYHPGDGHYHDFAALKTGDIWECLSRPGAERREYWLGKLDGGAINLAGYSAPDGTQHLFVASADGWSILWRSARRIGVGNGDPRSCNTTTESSDCLPIITPGTAIITSLPR
jgi:hypothetical protein